MNLKHKTIALIISSAIALTAVAGETKMYRVHFSLGGAGHDVTVLAESPSEARRNVMTMYDGAVVTGCREIKPVRK